MHRHALTDEHWAQVTAVLPPQKTGPAASLGDRSFVDAVIFRARTGVPWRDLPERFGPWQSVYNRFPRKLPKNRTLFAKRYLVEIFFHSLKRFRAIATRYEKTAASFLSLVHVCCAVLWLAETPES